MSIHQIRDAFVSYASEDRETFAKPLADLLRQRTTIWFDEYELRIGDSISRSIEKGIAKSRFGVLILTTTYFDKYWTTEELSALRTIESSQNELKLLPVWCNVTKDQVRTFSPFLADRKAMEWKNGLEACAESILQKCHLFSIQDHHANYHDIDISKCRCEGEARRPHWLLDTPELLCSQWLVDKLSKNSTVLTYFASNWASGTYFAVDPLTGDGVVLNNEQFERLATLTSSSVTTTTTTPRPW
jgi:hypothetical protein